MTKEGFYKIVNFMTTGEGACIRNPYPKGHEIDNFGTPFRCHHYYRLCLSHLCLRVEKKIFKEEMHFHYMTYMTMPEHKNPYSMGS